ncbi:MAG: hypothetical protein WBO70_00960 [Erysipelotrichaceae bacterium]
MKIIFMSYFITIFSFMIITCSLFVVNYNYEQSHLSNINKQAIRLTMKIQLAGFVSSDENEVKKMYVANLKCPSCKIDKFIYNYYPLALRVAISKPILNDVHVYSDKTMILKEAK